MIEGYFDPAGRPYVRAYMLVPGLHPAPEAITLLLDTGADNTFIQPAGARILGINTQDLTPTGTSRGIGGMTSYATMPAFIAFQERPWPWRKTRLVYFQIQLAVAVPDRATGTSRPCWPWTSLTVAGCSTTSPATSSSSHRTNRMEQ